MSWNIFAEISSMKKNVITYSRNFTDEANLLIYSNIFFHEAYFNAIFQKSHQLTSK